MAADNDDNFFSRWSRRKVQVRQGSVPAEPLSPPVPAPPMPAPPMPAPVVADEPVALVAEPVAQEPPPPPTMDDVAALTTASDFRRFVAPGVDADVKNAALKTLFTDPHFNVMDGLDTYIDDYNTPDPLPESWLRQMTQSAALGLFAEEPEPGATTESTRLAAAPLNAAAAEHAPTPTDLPEDPIPHEDADLRLQPHDAAGRQGPEAGAGPDAGRQH